MLDFLRAAVACKLNVLVSGGSDDHGTPAEFQKLADLHGRAAENGGNLHRDIVDRRDVAGETRLIPGVFDHQDGLVNGASGPGQ